MSRNQEHRETYKALTERLKSKPVLSELELRTLFHHLIRLPEAYKTDFIEVHLGDLLKKAEPKFRDQEIFNHYRHYVSIPSLASLLSVLRHEELAYGQQVVQLLEHIRNLQLIPGSSTRERERMEQLQFDLIYLLQKLQKAKQLFLVDLREPANRRKLAEQFYDRILASFLSENDDDLISENQFVEGLKLELLRGEAVQKFAARYSKEVGGERNNFLKELGLVISGTIQKAYLKNYVGIFNGSREDVIALFNEAIENRCLDSEEANAVDLESISSAILAIVLELIFNDGFSAFRQTLTLSIHQNFQNKNHG
jgi:hypothetical protein